ncbi:MAG: sugar ABC transporter substrate-binding protein [Burkholderiales bacterium]|nr:sugar ABC transporter substrate-binding protein [Burkholderiales bacterium]
MVVMRELSKGFEQQHPDIELDWRVLEEGTLRQRLMSDVAIADGQFDVMTVGTYEVPIWAKQGWIVPIAHLPPRYDVDDLLPTVRAALSFDRELYALPFYGESSMTYYRTDLFRQVGITMPAQPSYDEIADYAARLHDPAHGVYGVCLRGKPGWGENMALIGTMVDAYGGRWFDERWQAEIDGPAWHAAIGRYLDLLKRFGPPHAEQNGFNENLKLFADGHCAMWVDATVAAGSLFDPRQSRVANDLAYVAAPVAKTTRGTAWLWSWALAIPASSAHQRAAQAFVTWATSKEYVAQVAKRYGWIAVPPGTRRSTYANPGYRKAAPFGLFVEQAINSADLQTATLEPKPYIGIQYVGIPEFPAIGNQVGEEIARVLRGEQTADQALKRAQLLTVEQMKVGGYGQ